MFEARMISAYFFANDLDDIGKIVPAIWGHCQVLN